MSDDVGADEQGIHAVGADEVVHEALGIARIDGKQAAGYSDEIEAMLASSPLGRVQHALLEFVVIPVRDQPQARSATSSTGALLGHRLLVEEFPAKKVVPSTATCKTRLTVCKGITSSCRLTRSQSV